MDRSLALLLCALAAGCPADSHRLVVSLKTDMVPGREFHRVVVETWPPGSASESRDAAPPDGGAGAARQRMEVEVSRDDEYITASRVATFQSVPPGVINVRVTLLGRTGEVVADRHAIVEVRGITGVTVVITRSCVGVTCPPPEQPTFTTCASGRCVNPECTTESIELCDIELCTRDADCIPRALCVEPLCEDGVCLFAPVDERCEGADERCHPTMGCIGPICGDGICDDVETSSECPTDCGDACGDGSCSGDESSCGCPADCGASCGDGCCNGGETSSSCGGDCGASCGDGACNAGENTCGCPSDCGAVCGDGCCNGGESSCGCPADCGAICGDGCCNGGESCISCIGDCGGGACVCAARCCDGYNPTAVTNSNEECIALSMCSGHRGTLRKRRGPNGADGLPPIIWERSDACPVCCAKCVERDAAYQMVGVSSMCTEAARSWCSDSGRGGLEDAFWGTCSLPP